MEEKIIFKKFNSDIGELIKPLEKYQPEIQIEIEYNHIYILVDTSHIGEGISISDLKDFEEHIGKPISVQVKEGKILLILS